MTPNNLHGHTKNVEWKEIYREKIDDDLYVVITFSYERVYEGRNKHSYNCSSHGCVQSAVTDGSFHRWSNGVTSYQKSGQEGVDYFSKYKDEYKTKLGWKVVKRKLENNMACMIVEIPMEDVIKIVGGLNY